MPAGSIEIYQEYGVFMNKEALQALVNKMVAAIENLEAQCSGPTLKDLDKKVLHITELRRIKADLTSKLELIATFPDDNPNDSSKIAETYSKCEAQIGSYRAIINSKISYLNAVSKAGADQAALYVAFKNAVVAEVTSDPYPLFFTIPESYLSDTQLSLTLAQIGASPSSLQHLVEQQAKMIRESRKPSFEAAFALVEMSLDQLRANKEEAERRYNLIKPEAIAYVQAKKKKDGLWDEIGRLCGTVISDYHVDLQADIKDDASQIRALVKKAAPIAIKRYLTEGNKNLVDKYQTATRECENDVRALEDTIEQLKAEIELLKQKRETKLVQLNAAIADLKQVFEENYDIQSKKLALYGLDLSIISPIAKQFNDKLNQTNTDALDPVEFLEKKLAALKGIAPKLTEAMVAEQEFIAEGIVAKIEEVSSEITSLRKQLIERIRGRGLVFTEEETALLKTVDSYLIGQSHEKTTSPDVLEGKFKEAIKKRDLFKNVALPEIDKAIARSRQAKVASLEQELQLLSETFKPYYESIRSKLVDYGLWDEEGDIHYYAVQFEEKSAEKPGRDVDPILFYQEQLAELKEINEQLTGAVRGQNERLATAMVQAISKIAKGITAKRDELLQQMEGQNFKFDIEESKAIALMDNALITEAYAQATSPEYLDPVLQRAKEKKAKFVEISSTVEKAIERCTVIKIAELKESIANQKQVFKDVFNKVHADLGTYGLDHTAVSEINEEFDSEFNAINEDEIDPIEFHNSKLQALKAIATRLDSVVVQAENDIVVDLKHRIDSLVDKIETGHGEALAGKLKPEYQFDETEQALVDEFKIPLPRTYREWTDRAQLEEHMQALKIQKDGLADKSEKIKEMVAIHDGVAFGHYDGFFIEMNMADKAKATAMLTMLGRYLAVKNEKLQDCITSIGFEYIFKQPAIEAIEDLAQDNPEYSGMLEQLQFIKILSAKKIDAVNYLTSSSTVGVVNLLHEKGLDQFITKELLDNAELIKALGLINKYSSVEINEALMTQGILNKMAAVINKIDTFVDDYDCKPAVREQLGQFRKAAIPALLTDKSCEAKKKELCTLAHEHFEHQHFGRRVLADVLQFVTLAFIPLMLYRGYKGKSLLFSQAETNRESVLKRDILPALTDDKSNEAPQGGEELPKVEPQQ